jgi:hypothetical protein
MSTTFIGSINRGGLYRQSEYCYVTTISCWRIYEEIRSSAALKDELLGVGNQRKMFVEPATENGQLLVEDNFCIKGHDLKEQISKRRFNCVAKNLFKELKSSSQSTQREISQKAQDRQVDQQAEERLAVSGDED